MGCVHEVGVWGHLHIIDLNSVELYSFDLTFGFEISALGMYEEGKYLH